MFVLPFELLVPNGLKNVGTNVNWNSGDEIT